MPNVGSVTTAALADVDDLFALDERFRTEIFPILTPLAIDPGHPATAYALTDVEVRAVLDAAERGGSNPVDTGGCLVS